MSEEFLSQNEQNDDVTSVETTNVGDTEILEDNAESSNESKETLQNDDRNISHHSKSGKSSSSESKHSENKAFSKSEFFDWMEIIITAMIAVVLIFTVAFRVATIEGTSMVDTLHDKEKVLLSSFLYQPKNGDIVVISRNYLCDPNRTDSEAQPIIKRIIAVEGQTVSIDFDEGKVYVDGILLDEPYTNTPTTNALDFPTDGTAVTVPDGCVFVMGDNRNFSRDSRDHTIGNRGDGMVDTRYIIGKAVFRIFPFSSVGGLE